MPLNYTPLAVIIFKSHNLKTQSGVRSALHSGPLFISPLLFQETRVNELDQERKRSRH
jgi:hypothetical protein